MLHRPKTSGETAEAGVDPPDWIIHSESGTVTPAKMNAATVTVTGRNSPLSSDSCWGNASGSPGLEQQPMPMSPASAEHHDNTTAAASSRARTTLRLHPNNSPKSMGMSSDKHLETVDSTLAASCQSGMNKGDATAEAARRQAELLAALLKETTIHLPGFVKSADSSGVSYTEYHIRVSPPGTAGYSVYRRFRMFHSLYLKIQDAFIPIRTPFPSRSMFAVVDRAPLEQRRAQLQRFLQEVLSNPEAVALPEVRAFLELHRLTDEPPVAAELAFSDDESDGDSVSDSMTCGSMSTTLTAGDDTTLPLSRHCSVNLSHVSGGASDLPEASPIGSSDPGNESRLPNEASSLKLSPRRRPEPTRAPTAASNVESCEDSDLLTDPPAPRRRTSSGGLLGLLALPAAAAVNALFPGSSSQAVRSSKRDSLAANRCIRPDEQLLDSDVVDQVEEEVSRVFDQAALARLQIGAGADSDSKALSSDQDACDLLASTQQYLHGRAEVGRNEAPACSDGASSAGRDENTAMMTRTPVPATGLASVGSAGTDAPGAEAPAEGVLGWADDWNDKDDIEDEPRLYRRLGEPTARTRPDEDVGLPEVSGTKGRYPPQSHAVAGSDLPDSETPAGSSSPNLLQGQRQIQAPSSPGLPVVTSKAALPTAAPPIESDGNGSRVHTSSAVETQGDVRDDTRADGDVGPSSPTRRSSESTPTTPLVAITAVTELPTVVSDSPMSQSEWVTVDTAVTDLPDLLSTATAMMASQPHDGTTRLDNAVEIVDELEIGEGTHDGTGSATQPPGSPRLSEVEAFGSLEDPDLDFHADSDDHAIPSLQDEPDPIQPDL